MNPRAYTPEERAEWLPVLAPVLAASEKSPSDFAMAVSAVAEPLVRAVAAACGATPEAVDDLTPDDFLALLARVLDLNAAAARDELVKLIGEGAHGPR